MAIISQMRKHHRQKIQIFFWFVFCAVLVLSLWFGDLKISTVDDFDKIKHFSAYFALSFLLAMGWTLPNTRAIALAFASLFILGGSIEWLQSLPIIGRTTSIWDILANTIGSTLGLPAGMLMRRL